MCRISHRHTVFEIDDIFFVCFFFCYLCDIKSINSDYQLHNEFRCTEICSFFFFLARLYYICRYHRWHRNSRGVRWCSHYSRNLYRRINLCVWEVKQLRIYWVVDLPWNFHALNMFYWQNASCSSELSASIAVTYKQKTDEWWQCYSIYLDKDKYMYISVD